MSINIFEEEWRNCLRAHFAYVIRERDTNNEQSLITVLRQTGFTDDEIAAFRQETWRELGWLEPEGTESETEPEIIEAESGVPEAAESETVGTEAFATESIEPEAVAPEPPEVIEPETAAIVEPTMTPIGEELPLSSEEPAPSGTDSVAEAALMEQLLPLVDEPDETPPEEKPTEVDKTISEEPLLKPSKKSKKPPKQLSLF